ncbi:class F sortase [Pseudoclavibacter sp. VKM Ac-2867]|uniref:class F sortase n=1 Tax=Pseudoclavibacter sp. VKM Ac-2867 TaxID=2783829 RepID=UPI002B268D89|nr:sortase [Pseudoclavibacter sp. VKM Ac-2867]
MTRNSARVPGRVLRVPVLVVAAALLVSGCAAAPSGDASPSEGVQSSTTAVESASEFAPESAPEATPPAQVETPAAPPAGGVEVLPEGVAPTAVSIPAIGVEDTLIDLGIAADGKMEVPVDFDEIGWFTGGGKPGGRGPTVIAAHVDGLAGPAAFFRLDELAAGDVVSVSDVEGGVTSYQVTEVVTVEKAEFPTARVFGAVPGDELRLITCGGYFDRDVGHYDKNVVVFATAV